MYKKNEKKNQVYVNARNYYIVHIELWFNTNYTSRWFKPKIHM